MKIQPPEHNYESSLGSAERQLLSQIFTCSAVGSAQTVEHKIRAFLQQTEADELIFTGNAFDHQDRLNSFECAATVMAAINESGCF